MKEERILRALNDINEAYIEEAAPPKAPRQKPWKAVAGLAACLCVVALIATPLFSQGGGRSEPPESNYPYAVAIQDGTAYFPANGKMYAHVPGDDTPTELASFRGTFHSTSTGVYAVDEGTGEVYTADGNTLTPLTTIDSTGRYRLLGVVDGGLYWTIYGSANSTATGTLVYRTDLTSGDCTEVFSYQDSNNYDSKLPGRMADGKIWFTQDVGFCYYDLSTGETVTYCTSFWSQHAESWWEPVYYEDFMLCRVIQYNEAGDTLGHPYYRLDYGAAAPALLTNYTSLSGDPSLHAGSLYYVTDLEGTRSLVALAPGTGDLEDLFQGDWTPEELAVTDEGMYYSQDYDLYFYDYDTQEAVKLVDKAD